MIHITTSNDIIKKRREIISLIVRIRLEKGLSQSQLAEIVGMHRSNICRIESRRQNISIDTLIRIFDALGFDISITLKDK